MKGVFSETHMCVLAAAPGRPSPCNPLILGCNLSLLILQHTCACSQQQLVGAKPSYFLIPKSLRATLSLFILGHTCVFSQQPLVGQTLVVVSLDLGCNPQMTYVLQRTCVFSLQDVVGQTNPELFFLQHTCHMCVLAAATDLPNYCNP